MTKLSTSGGPRAYLFVPANRPERIAKAWRSGAHAVIVDLEDAVAADDKAAARDLLADHLDPDAPVLVRVNGVGTPWHEEDTRLCRMPGVQGVMVPKAEEPEDLRALAMDCESDRLVIPIIESARGFDRARELAASGLASRLAFGSIDFQLDLGIEGDGDELLYFRSRLVLVSRRCNLPAPIDGVTLSIDVPDAVRADTLRARRLGFGAKLCIHPNQVAIVNACFEPAAEERAWALRVMEATRRSNGSAVSVDGKMVDVPVIRKARIILGLALDGQEAGTQ